MSIPLPQATPEWHTTDLAGCPKLTQLRRAGKVDKSCPSALYRGALANAALTWLHDHSQFDHEGIDRAMQYALKFVDRQMKAEERLLTETVQRDVMKNAADVADLMVAYCVRFGSQFEAYPGLGTELPVRLEIGGKSFASHLDLAFRDPEDNRLTIWDWKNTLKDPTRHYLARNRQLIMYCLAGKFGQIAVDTASGEGPPNWVEFDEWPRIAWIHLPNLLPYKRGGKRPGDDSTYSKGDQRPLDAVVKRVDFREERADGMMDELVSYVSMLEAGIYPRIPDPIGCYLCPGQEFCTRFDMPPTDFDQ